MKKEIDSGLRMLFLLSVWQSKEPKVFAFRPELQGCYTQDETYEEALQNIRDAIKGHVEESLANGEPISS